MTSTMAPARALRQRLLAELEEARARTLLLVAPLSDEELHTQHDPLMSPILWDLGHIAHFEELWLTRNLDGPIEFVEMPGMYNPFEHPRSTRGALPLPGLDRVREVMSEIRARVLDRLQSADFDADQPLLASGYVYRMVLQHEYQHNETILQTLQLKLGTPYSPPARVELPVVGEGLPVTGMVRFPGGRVEIGTDDRTEAYDNERPRHAVDVRPFEIDAHPVTNGQYLEFIEAGGYARPELWSEAGRRWLEESRAEGPKYWFRNADGWMTRVMDRVGAVQPDHPVCHVCYYEAEAFARWAGKRLPSEIEWEAAASWDPDTGRKLRYPWGDEPPSRELANLDQLGFGTAAVAAFPRNRSPIGCCGMIGDVWEWTVERLRGLARVRGVPLSGILRGLLRQRVQGPSRGFVGHPPWCDAQHLPQLGLPHPPPDLQRLQVRP